MSRRNYVRTGESGRRLGRAALASAALVGGAGLLAAAAHAGDQSLTGSISEKLLGDTNYQLDPDAKGTLGAETTLNLAYENVTPTESMNLRSSLRYNAYSGDTGNNSISGLFPNVSGGYRRERSDQALSLNFNASVKPVEFSSTSFVLLPTDPTDPVDPTDPEPTPEIGLVSDTDETLRAIFSIGSAYDYTVNSTETLQFSASARRTDYLDDTGGLYSPSTTVDFGAGWSHQASSSWSTGLRTGVTVIQTDDDADRNTVTLFAAPSLGYARTPNQTFDISVGPSVSFISGGQRASEIQPGIRASIGARYVAGPTTFSGGVSNAIQPSDKGVSSNVTSLSAVLDQRIDATQSLRATASSSLQTPLDEAESSGEITRYNLRGAYTLQVNPRTSGEAGLGAAYTDGSTSSETAYSVNASLSYRLTEETSANLGYVFRIEDSDGMTTSHRVSLTLRRNFSLLP